MAPEGPWTIVARRNELAGARRLVRSWRESFPPGAEGEGARPAHGVAGRGKILAATGAGGRALVIKILRRGGLFSGVGGGRYGHSRLLLEMSILEEAKRRGVPTAEMAWGASRKEPLGAPIALLATRRVEGSLSLAEVLASAQGAGASGSERYDLLRRSGAAVRRMHDRGLDHSDLNIGNILVRPPRGDSRARALPDPLEGAGAWVIDLGVSKLGASLPPGRRAGNLVRLLRSAEKHLGADPMRSRDAAAFLHGYLGGGEKGGRALRRAMLPAIRRRLPTIALHRLGWTLTRSASTRRPQSRPR